VARRRTVPLLVLLLATATATATACGGGDTVKGPVPKAPDAIALSSPAFAAGATIPRRYTCDGKETSPPLRWTPPPKATRSLALLVEDPDAPAGTFVHWTLNGLAPEMKGLDEDAVPHGGRQGANSSGDTGYAGPCPPRRDGAHRYVFTLYTLRSGSLPQAGAKPDRVRKAIVEAAIARGRLVGTFKRG
jgi:Raf kinase inhibitor-like YbhB/YbcL family protein